MIKQLFFTAAAFLMPLCMIAQTGPKGLETGKKAPDFSKTDQNGTVITLHEVLKKGPVVLLFYRGQWCPYCNRQLKQLEDSLSMITAKGATIIAVTPEKPENVTKTVGKTGATYSILTDDGMQVMKMYDVAYAVDSAMNGKLKAYGIDLDVANGHNGSNLPVPTVYIIGRNGAIIYRHFDADYTKRASVKEILTQL